MRLTVFFLYIYIGITSFCLAHSPAWTPGDTKTIFFQGMSSSHMQCARLTGTTGFYMTTGEKVQRDSRYGLDFEVIKHPFIGAEIDEIMPAPTNNLTRHFLEWCFQPFIDCQYQFVITPPAPKKEGYSLATHVPIFTRFNIGQQGDICNHFRKVVLHYFLHGERDRMAYGISRGAAATFNAEAIYNIMRNATKVENSEICTCIRLLKDEYDILYALAHNAPRPSHINKKHWEDSQAWWSIHVTPQHLEFMSLPHDHSPDWQSILREPRLIILESCFDSVMNIINNPSCSLSKRLNHRIQYILLSMKLISFKKSGISPLLMASYFPDVPVVFVTSRKDTKVPYPQTINLVEHVKRNTRKSPLYVLSLDNSSHNGYAYDDPQDSLFYLWLMHAIYKEQGLSYIPEHAQHGTPLLELVRC